MANETIIYSVPGISCDHCKRRIENEVLTLAGIESVEVDVDAKSVTVTGGDPVAVEAAIVEAGYAIA